MMSQGKLDFELSDGRPCSLVRIIKVDVCYYGDRISVGGRDTVLISALTHSVAR
jgi:hypothetical protein